MIINKIRQKLAFEERCIVVERDMKDYVPKHRLEDYDFRIMNDSEEDFCQWKRIIEEGYGEGSVSRATYEGFSHRISYFETAFLQVDGNPVATISYGQSEDKHWGTDCRIAVLPEEKGKGYGSLVVDYAMNRLKENGCVRFSSSIGAKRKISAFTHFGLGCKPKQMPVVEIHGLFRRGGVKD